jgi:hypothetical protein
MRTGRASTSQSQRNELAELLDGLLEAAAAVVEGVPATMALAPSGRLSIITASPHR